MNTKSRLAILAFLSIAFICAVAYVISQQEGILLLKATGTKEDTGSTQPHNSNTIQTPTPVPFQEMTIPYLRSRSYESTMGTRETVGDMGTYTSYVTSYTSDELTIYGQLTIPSGEQPEQGWPAVVFVHGYIPPFQYETLGRYGDYVDYLARSGFVVFKIDLRGHGNSEGMPGGAYYSSDYVIDTLNARAALQNEDFVNQNAVGLWGHSMAGNIVLRSMAVRPEIPAGVIWGGAVYSYSDFLKYRITDGSYVRPPEDQVQQRESYRQRLFATHGEFSPDSAFWKQVAATNYLQDFTGAVQVHHAVDDDVVTVNYARDLKTALEQNDISHEVIEYPTGGHNLSGITFVTAMENTVTFYKRHLK